MTSERGSPCSTRSPSITARSGSREPSVIASAAVHSAWNDTSGASAAPVTTRIVPSATIRCQVGPPVTRYSSTRDTPSATVRPAAISAIASIQASVSGSGTLPSLRVATATVSSQ